MKKYFNIYNTTFVVMCFFFCITLSIATITFPALLILIILDACSYMCWRVLTKNLSDEELCEKMGFKDTMFDFTKE
jgi:hypothetical protein